MVVKYKSFPILSSFGSSYCSEFDDNFELAIIYDKS